MFDKKIDATFKLGVDLSIQRIIPFSKQQTDSLE